ncbi:hypothetical protein EAE93_12715 [Photorhabdus akhurstii]|nr:hypothetical protein [Photorhabdus akhurstii]
MFSYWLSKAESVEGFVTTEFNYITRNDQKKAKCLTLLKKSNSIASISREISKSRCFVKAAALGAKISTRLKPTKLTPLVCQIAIELATKGFHRKEIARRLSISTGSIELIVSTTDGLVNWRKHESKRRRYQLQILRYRQYHPEAIRHDIKFDCNAAFFWLYKHEREWLEINLPEPTPLHQSPRAK